MKKRLLIVTEALEMNGVLRSLLDFMEAIDKDRYQIDLFCFDAYKPSFVTLPAYVRLLPEDAWCYMARAPFSRIFRWAIRHGAIWPLMRRLLVSLLQNHSRQFNKQDLALHARRLVCQYDVACAYSMGMTWRYVAEKVSATKKLFWLDTDVRFEPWRSVWRKYAKHLESGTLICISNAVQDLMIEEFSEQVKRVHTIHNVVDVESIVRKSEAELTISAQGKFRIVTVGRFCSAKNQVVIPEIAKRLRELGVENFEWIMVGPGAKEHRIEDPNLVYVDSLPNPMPLIKSADLYVQTSSYEGWGLTVSEALCLGRYVIASDIPAFREQILSPEEGRVVPCEIESFVCAIAEYFRSPIRRSEVQYSRFGFDSNRKEFEDALV